MSYQGTADFIGQHYEWLMFDDSGMVIGKLNGNLNQGMAQLVADTLGTRLESAPCNAYALGDTLPVWHESGR